MVGAFVLINDIAHHWEAERVPELARPAAPAIATEEDLPFTATGAFWMPTKRCSGMVGYSLLPSS